MLDKKTRDRLYYQKNKTRINMLDREYYRKNRDKVLAWTKKWKTKPEVMARAIIHRRNYKQRKRRLCIDHYSGGKMKCACCPENIYEFLTIDHINGGGHKHKKIHNGALYNWLVKNQFPEGYRVLCWNCNCALGLY